MSRDAQEFDVSAIEERVGHRFRDRSILERALTHRSFANEAWRSAERNYERLEFLGDALLGFLVAEHLYRADPDADEGVLTRRKQVVVRSSTLASAASALGLGEAMRLSRGEHETGGRSKESLLADVFEAVLGAVYRDGGIRTARAFLRRHLADDLRNAAEALEVDEDYKTRLQERVQGELRVTPTYRIVSMTGPDHDRRFRAEVRLGTRVVGAGTGTSRKRAEQRAAAAALEALDLDHDGKESE
jgi:ribonuclease-3